MVGGVAPLQDLTALVRRELECVQSELSADLRPESQDLDPLIERAASYRGKLLRPALVCLSGKTVGRLGREHVEVAKIVELLHTATLVHDDVLDDADLRRRVPTVNAAWGNEVSVLLGDYLYARAFHMSVQLDDPTCSRVLGDVVRRICQGEITQILHRFDFDWSEARYFEVITEKTALLYGAACRLGGHYAGGGREQCEVLARFGTEVGIAFQIADDILDLDGEEGVVGKSLGTDLGKGKLTLPLLWLVREAGARERLEQLMRSELTDAEKLRRLAGEFPLTDALAYAQACARNHVTRALDALGTLPVGPAREAMAAIAEYVVARRV